jgi:aminoglycoside phosphotransferase (APT) family kinase protein
VACGREQARLHQTPASPALGATHWLDRFGPLDPELAARLRSAQSPTPALIHLDFHADNILVAGRQVSGILDWTNACAGDGRADLARTWSLLIRRQRTGVRAWATGSIWRLVAAGWHRGYEQVAGSQSDMPLFRIWALTGLLNTLRSEAERADQTVEEAMLQVQLGKLRASAGLPPLCD